MTIPLGTRGPVQCETRLLGGLGFWVTLIAKRYVRAKVAFCIGLLLKNHFERAPTAFEILPERSKTLPKLAFRLGPLCKYHFERAPNAFESPRENQTNFNFLSNLHTYPGNP